MNEIVSYKELLMSSLQTFAQQAMQSLSAIFGVLVLLIIGWWVARTVAFLCRKLLNMLKFDQFAERVKANDMLKKANISQSPTTLLSQLLYWIILLLFIVTATDKLGWSIVSEQISKLISFIPTLLSGLILFILGSFIAGFIRDILNATTASIGMGAGRLVSNFVFYFLMAIITLTVLNQIGIDTSIITSNVVMFMGAILLSASISYGFASREILSNMLAAFFNRKTFTIGQTIRIGDVQGVIIKMDTLSITLQTNTDKVVIPSKDLISTQIHIID
jgi:hypothetical protein